VISPRNFLNPHRNPVKHAILIVIWLLEIRSQNIAQDLMPNCVMKLGFQPGSLHESRIQSTVQYVKGKRNVMMLIFLQVEKLGFILGKEWPTLNSIIWQAKNPYLCAGYQGTQQNMLLIMTHTHKKEPSPVESYFTFSCSARNGNHCVSWRFISILFLSIFAFI
jgi:hypothetical protein